MSSKLNQLIHLPIIPCLILYVTYKGISIVIISIGATGKRQKVEKFY